MRLRLLEGSAQLFPALVAAIDAARQEVWLETYIFDFNGASAEVAWALERAARRGVHVRVLVDGFGTGEPPPAWRLRLVAAGVDWRAYAPPGRFGVLRPASWRRLHRKLCVVDEQVAFCGGINILDDLHDPNHGALEAPRLDFAVQVVGPAGGRGPRGHAAAVAAHAGLRRAEARRARRRAHLAARPARAAARRARAGVAPGEPGRTGAARQPAAPHRHRAGLPPRHRARALRSDHRQRLLRAGAARCARRW